MLFKTNKQKNITLKNGVGVGWVAKNFDEKLGWSLWTMELGKQFLNLKLAIGVPAPRLARLESRCRLR